MAKTKKEPRDLIIEAHRAEGEPQTMARVEGMCAERWPGRTATVWIERVDPRRHVFVRFVDDAIEGAGETWLEAFDAVDAKHRAPARRTGGDTFSIADWRDIYEALMDAANLYHSGPKADRAVALAQKIREEKLS